MMKVDVKAPYNDLPFLPPAAELETKEVLRYRDAMWTAYNGLKDRRLLTTNLFISIVREIKQAEIGIRNTPGTHLKNDRTGEIDYTPPEGKETIRQKLVNLEKYIHAEEARRKLPDRVYSKDLLECIFEHPYTKVQFLVELGIAKRQTAAEYLKLLESAGILRSVKRGREVFYINTKLFDLLSGGTIEKPGA